MIRFYIKNSSILLLLALLISSTQACEDPPPLRLTSSQRAEVDTMYLDLVPQLAEEMDSICAARFDAAVDRAVDSIIAVHRAEEAALRKKYEAQ